MELALLENLAKFGPYWTFVAIMIIVLVKYLPEFIRAVFVYIQNQTDISVKIKDDFEIISTNLASINRQNERQSKILEKLFENYVEVATKVACLEINLTEKKGARK